MIPSTPKRRGRPRKVPSAALAETLRQLKAVMERRRAAPGWTLTLDQVAYVADILSGQGRVYPRQVWQTTGGDPAHVAALLDEWWRELIRTHPARHAALDAPTREALAWREKLTQISGVVADAPSNLDPRALLADADQLQRYQHFERQLEQVLKDNAALREENRQHRTEVLELKRELAAALGTVFREVREPMSGVTAHHRKIGHAHPPPASRPQTARSRPSAKAAGTEAPSNRLSSAQARRAAGHSPSEATARPERLRPGKRAVSRTKHGCSDRGPGDHSSVD